MTKQLSKTQAEVLRDMVDRQEYTAYELGASLNTLWALQERGMITHYFAAGYLFAPRNCIHFRITAAGIEAAKAQEQVQP